MKILIDACLPAGLKGTLTVLGHECQTVRKTGFGSKKNGEFPDACRGPMGCVAHRRSDIKFQQNMTGRSVSILILPGKSNRMVDLLPLMPACSEALLSIKPGQVVEVEPL